MTAPATDTKRDPSPDSSTSSDPEANSSRLHLPPHLLASADAAYEGDTPNTLADHLFLRPHPPSRSSSWHSILDPDSAHVHHAAHHPPPASPRPPSHLAHHDIDHADDRDATYPARPRPTTRSSHSRSKSRVRNLKWYHRPSPIWFFPGTFLLAMTGGMIISPKLEIYTQLICRAMPVEKSHVSLPPPLVDAQPVTGVSPIAGAPISTTPVNSTSTSTSSSSHSGHQDRLFFEWTASPAPVLGVDRDSDGHLDTATTTKDGDSWSLQCQKSSAVQAAVAQLVRPLSLSRTRTGRARTDPFLLSRAGPRPRPHDGRPLGPHDRLVGRLLGPPRPQARPPPRPVRHRHDGLGLSPVRPSLSLPLSLALLLGRARTDAHAQTASSTSTRPCRTTSSSSGPSWTASSAAGRASSSRSLSSPSYTC